MPCLYRNTDTLFRNGKLPSQPTCYSFGAPLGDVFAKPTPAPLTDRLLSFGTCLCYFFPSSRFLYIFYIIQYKFRFVKCFFVNNRGCKKRTPFYLPPPSISRLGTVVVCASASLASTDAGFAKPCIKPPSDVDETSPAIIVSSTTIRFAFTVSALSG